MKPGYIHHPSFCLDVLVALGVEFGSTRFNRDVAFGSFVIQAPVAAAHGEYKELSADSSEIHSVGDQREIWNSPDHLRCV